jgi:hypothetical protein
MSNIKVEEYKIKLKDFNAIEKFVAQRKEDAELYLKRGGFKEEDLWVGAMAEFAVYYYLREREHKVNKPDLTIHTKKDKSYDADLVTESKFFHVKGQSLTSQKRYGNSWLLQRYDKIVKNPLPNHYIVPCSVDVENRTVTIFGTISLSSIHRTDSFSECKYYLFQKTKVALYLDELYDKIKGIWRI